MKKVMIVDDERPARELLKMAIDWEKAGYEIVAEAKNGKDAYEQCKLCKPDVVITDIQMPVMDGIQFIEAVKREKGRQHFVILSCHESFQYAQKAMKLGVEDYLIKDSYSSTELYLLLEHLNDREDECHFRDINNLEQRNENLEGQESLIRQAVLGDAVAMEKLQKTIGYGRKQFFMCLLPLKELQERIGRIPMEIIREIQLLIGDVPNCFTMAEDANHILILVFFESNNSLLKNINSRHLILARIREQMERIIDMSMTMGCSNIHQNLSELGVCIEEAKKALKYMVFTRKRKVVYFEAIPDTTKLLEVDMLNKYIAKAQEAFENEDNENLQKYLNQIYGLDMQGMAQCNYLEYANSIFYGYINQLISQKRLNLEKLWNGEILSFSELNNLESVKEMREWIYSRLCSIMQALKQEYEYSEYVSKSIAYIKQNYKDDIKVESIADSIGIHKVYLSRVFKKETGVSLNTYLNEYRIKKAIEMMNVNNMRMSDIIYEVGYNNAQNYYYAFKQVTGVTPREYMKNVHE